MKTEWVIISMGCCSLISLNMFIVSFLSPGWLVYNDFNKQDLELHMGLFYFNQCVDKRRQCSSEFYDELPAVVTRSRDANSAVFNPLPFGTDKIYTEYFVEMLVSIVFMVFASCFVFMYLRVSPPAFLTVAIVLLLIPGILVWVATGRFLKMEYFRHAEMGIPYCLILNGIGASLCFIVIIILIIVMMYDWQRYNSRDRTHLVKRQEPVHITNPQYVTSQPQLVYY